MEIFIFILSKQTLSFCLFLRIVLFLLIIICRCTKDDEYIISTYLQLHPLSAHLYSNSRRRQNNTTDISKPSPLLLNHLIGYIISPMGLWCMKIISRLSSSCRLVVLDEWNTTSPLARDTNEYLYVKDNFSLLPKLLMNHNLIGMVNQCKKKLSDRLYLSSPHFPVAIECTVPCPVLTSTRSPSPYHLLFSSCISF